VCPSLLKQSVLSPKVPVLQQLVLYLDVSVQQQPVLSRRWPTAACAAPGLSVSESQCCTETCLSTSAFVCSEMSVDWSLSCTYACPSTKALCCTWTCLSSRACANLCMSVYQSFVLAPGRVCLQEPVPLCLSVNKSFELHLDVPAYNSPVYAAPGGAQFTKMFQLFRLVSKQVC
jgi:hypothetical protein